MSISGYRRLLRCINKSFKNDVYAIKSGKVQLKSEFMKYKNLTDIDEISALHRGINEVEEMLNFNIVQGKLNERGNFEVPLSSEHIVTVEAAQKEPLGPAIEPFDRSVLGKDVRIDKSSKSK